MPGNSDGTGTDSEAAGEPGFEDTAATGTEGTGNEGEPGLGNADASGIPDMTDEPSLEDSIGAFEDAMGDSDIGLPGGSPQGLPTGNSPYGIPGYPGGGGTIEGEGEGSGGSGTLTPAEQVAILDGQLERGTGEFDAMILDEQAAQRRAAREQASRTPTPSSTTASEGTGSSEGPMADSGGYSAGGGMPGAPLPGGGGASNIPQNTAKYPAPTDIPSGGDDDVVARQLREAAMREPDPAIREKLWEEYRKYKGISS
jgi:hypothetical protein